MNYLIKLAKEAESDLDRLEVSDRKIFRRIIVKIESLMENPYDGKPLVGNHKGEFSLRVGNYRIIYTIDHIDCIIYILTVKHRKHVY